MSKYCPILERKVVYFVCEDCDDKAKCRGAIHKTYDRSNEERKVNKNVR